MVRALRYLAALCVATAASALIAAVPASAAKPRIHLRRITMYIYDAKVGVSGGESDSWGTGDTSNAHYGDSVQNSSSGSFHIDGTIHQMWFSPGWAPHGAGKAGNGYSHAVVNGSWSDQGTKLIGQENNVPITAPYTCSGRIGPAVSPQMQLEWKSSGSKLKFTLHAVQEELYIQGWSESCPNDDTAAWLSGVAPVVYDTTFSIPAHDIGRKSFSATVSGPLAENFVFWHQNCPSDGTCSLRWQGSVRFTLKRTFKTVTVV